MRAIAVAAAAALLAHPAAAQEAPPPKTANPMLETARRVYSVRPSRAESCPSEREGEIVVCRRIEDPETLRVPSATEAAIAAGKPVYDGLPRAPDVFGLPSCEIVKCIGFGSVPPPPLIIDLKAIPEPPPGSDAASYGYQPPAGDR